jgi:bisphosphoglycerate-independent phosphoglycerate mutase (AlkP superfamily)
MLITFKSKAHSDVVMYRENAQRILDLLQKDAVRGAITAEEAVHAVSVIEGEVQDSRKHHATNEVEQDIRANHGSGEHMEHQPAQTVSFAARAFPLLEMLRAARDQGADVLWGV